MTSEAKWLQVARSLVGIHEDLSSASNQRVLSMFLDAGHPEIKSDAVPWCAAFVGACLKRAGIKNSGSLAAKSYETWGQALKEPVLGCVGVKNRAGGSKWQGHVGFVVGATKDRVFLLGGNQSDQVSVASFPRKDFTAFRWPANMPIMAPPLPNTLAAAKNVRED